MSAIKHQIPNLLTLSNLLCGCLAIKYAFEWDLVMAAYLVGLAAVFDFLDGFAARLLKVSGEMGKQLDSLADMVSFGVVPGVVMFQMMRIVSFEMDPLAQEFHWGIMTYTLTVYKINDFISPVCYIAFLIPVLSAYRLAKFNLDTRQTDKFIGLPTPANAIFICALGLIFIQFLGYDVRETINWLSSYPLSNWSITRPEPFTLYDFPVGLMSESEKSEEIILASLISRSNLLLLLIGITLVFSLLLISELPLFALKFKNFGWKENNIRYIFLGISAAMLIIFQVLAIPFIIILYLLLSIINNYTIKQ